MRNSVAPLLALVVVLSGSASLLSSDCDGDGLDEFPDMTRRNFGLTSGPELSVGTQLSSVRAADVDGDGDTDLITGDDSGSASLFLNDGTGTFQLRRNLVVEGRAESMVVADLDGDGDDDLAAGNPDSQLISILLNDGAGRFSRTTKLAVNGPPVALVAFDFEQDGDIDLAAAHQAYDDTCGCFRAPLIEVLRNTGDGGFTGPSARTTGIDELLHTFTTGDLDGDGLAELVVTFYQSRSIATFPNNGDGTFGVVEPVDVDRQPGAFAVGDLDGDGDGDLIFGGRFDPGLVLLLNAGRGRFEPRELVVPEKQTDEVIALDLEGDGDIDLVLSDRSRVEERGEISVLLNDGGGRFSAPRTVAGGRSPSGLTIAHLNGDVRWDLALIDTYDAGALLVLFGEPDQRLKPPVTLAVSSSPTSVAAADLDADGHADFVTANTSPYDEDCRCFRTTSMSVLLAARDGSFRASESYTVEGSPVALAVSDFDDDGDRDLVTAFQAPATELGGLEVFLNDRSGVFSRGDVVRVPGSLTSVAAGDLDGDGDGDVAAADADNGRVLLFLNDGGAKLEHVADFTVGAGPIALLALDLDGERGLDLVTANETSGTVSVLFNRGGGAFEAASHSAVGDAPGSLAAADLDGDARVDLVTGNRGSIDLSLLINHGGGRLEETERLVLGTPPMLVTAVDLDRDGDVDIFVRNSGLANDVFLNRDGAFSLVSSRAGRPRAGALTTVDFDGDSDLDVALVGPSSPSGELIENTTIQDLDRDGVPDGCGDCDGNDIEDHLDIESGRRLDCNQNRIPDRCDLASGRSEDVNDDGIPDECPCGLEAEILERLVLETAGRSVRPGGHIGFTLGVWQCCTFVEPVAACVSWSIEPPDAAVIALSPDAEVAERGTGTIHVRDSTLHGTRLVLTANVDSGSRLLTAEVFVYTPEENPLVGFWEETTQLGCDDSFVRGDLDQNRAPEVTDAIRILDFLFVEGGDLSCAEAADVNGDRAIDIGDAVYLLTYLFGGGPPPPPPFPECGPPPDGSPFDCREPACGGEFPPIQPIAELVFEADGTLRVTWWPFETYVDYWGTYEFDLDTGVIVIDPLGGNYVPPDLKPAGIFSLTGDELEFDGLWFGRPSEGPEETHCGHRFRRW